jgi:hypothetical protein
VIRQTLPNGLPLVVLPRPGAPVTALRLHVGAGSGDEAPGRRGVAHLIEHLVVRCSMRGGRWGAGMPIAASTGRAHTAYHVVADPSDVAAAAGALLAAFAPLRVDGPALSGELRAIRPEVAERTGEPQWRLRESLFAALWRDTGYAHNPLGDLAELATVTAADLRDWHATRYRPDSSVLVVASGDPDRDAAALHAAAARPHHAPRAAAGPRPAPPPAGSVVTVLGEPGRTLVGLARGGPSGGTPWAGRALARAAARSAGIHVHQMDLPGHLCTWLLLRAPDPPTAAGRVRAALRTVRKRLTGPGAAAWLAGTATIPLLRDCDQVDALPRLWLDGPHRDTGVPLAETLRSTGPAEVATVIADWETWQAEVSA